MVTPTLPMPVVHVGLVVCLMVESAFLWRGLTEEWKRYYAVLAGLVGAVFGVVLAYDMVLLLNSLESLANPTPVQASTNPLNLGSTLLMLGHSAALIPIAVLAGAALFVFRHRHVTSVSSLHRWRFVGYLLAGLLAPYLSWLLIFKLISWSFAVESIPMTTLYVSIAVWICVGIVSLPYYLLKTPLAVDDEDAT